jgi:hypothetical protein
MIYESHYWKEDLLKLAKKLERRLIQRRWSEKSYFTLEKELFFGFYAIRKLIEAHKLTTELATRKFSILEIPVKYAPSVFDKEPDLEKIEIGLGTRVPLTIKDICNQFIHSHHMTPLTYEAQLIGIFICSDRKCKTGIYLITIFDIVEIYRLVGGNYPTYVRRSISETGKIAHYQGCTPGE